MKTSRWSTVLSWTLVLVIALTAVAGPFATVALAGPRDGAWSDLPALPAPPHSPRAIGPLGTIADTLDMSVPRMLLALRFRYDSIGDLAEAQGTDPEALVQAVVDEAAEHLSHADNLTPAQVDWILEQVERKASAFIYTEFPYGAGSEVLQPAADGIGISVEALVDALQDGQTIAEVAEANGTDAATVEQAIVDYRASVWGEAVEVGLLTQTQMDVLVDLYSAKVPDIVNGEFSPEFDGAPTFGNGPLVTIADELNMTVPQMLNALYTRHDSIADLAQVRRTDPDALVQVLVDNAAARLDNTDNLTQEQVDWILEQVERKANGFIYVEFPYGVAIDVLQPAAAAIGIPIDNLVDALQEGHTIADVAIADGVDPDTVEEALVDHRAGNVAGAVDVGLLTETQADIVLDLYNGRADDIVTRQWPNGQLLELIIERLISDG